MLDSFCGNYFEMGEYMNEEAIGRLLYIANIGKEKYHETLKECSEKLGIARQEVDVLLFLNTHPLYNRACDVVNFRGLSKAYVSKALNSLLQNGFIRMELDSKDRRYQHIILEKKAEEIISYMRMKRRKMFESLIEGIPEEEMNIFFKVAELMIYNLKKEEGGKSV